ITETARSYARLEVIFTRDVAPIIFKNCADCHRPNDIAPFSVLTYKDVRPWARSIRERVITRQMPPWPPDPRSGDLINDEQLSHTDIDIIVAGVDQGAKEGDAKLLSTRPYLLDGWKIGTPDQVLSMSEEWTVKPDDSDNYVYAVIPTGFQQARWIKAAEIRPTN